MLLTPNLNSLVAMTLGRDEPNLANFGPEGLVGYMSNPALTVTMLPWRWIHNGQRLGGVIF